MAVIKKIFFAHESQVHRGKLFKMAKNFDLLEGVEWGGVDGAGWNEVKWDGVEESKVECISTECGRLV